MDVWSPRDIDFIPSQTDQFGNFLDVITIQKT